MGFSVPVLENLTGVLSTPRPRLATALKSGLGFRLGFGLHSAVGEYVQLGGRPRMMSALDQHVRLFYNSVIIDRCRPPNRFYSPRVSTLCCSIATYSYCSLSVKCMAWIVTDNAPFLCKQKLLPCIYIIALCTRSDITFYNNVKQSYW